MSTENPVVIDLGSESIKAGYASQVPSEHEPRIVTPSLVTVNSRGARTDSHTQQQQHRVIDRGFVANWDHLEAILHYLFYEQLGWVLGEEGSVLFVEPLFVGKSEREQLVQLLFERFNVMGMFVHDAAVLSQFAAGKLTGCTVDIGHGKIDIATVSEGTTNAPGAVRLSFAGEQLTQLLGQLMQQQQQQQQQLVQQPLPLQQLNALKVQCCKAAASADVYRQLMTRQQQGGSSSLAAAAAVAAAGPSQGPEGSTSQQQQQQLGVPEEFTLPDGAKFTVTTEGYQVAEALFDPTLLGHHTPGLVDCILESLNDHPDPSLKRSILESVLICGGGACIPGLGERVLQDMRAQLPNSLVPSLCQLPEYMAVQSPQYVPWVGGAVMAKLVAHQGHFMIKAEYEEVGPSAVHRKCA